MTAEPDSPMNDRKLEQIIGNLLRIGVAFAVLLVAFGGAKHLYEHQREPQDRATFTGEPRELETLGGIARLAWQLNSLGLIQLGILVLVATPIARVVFSVYGFWLERDLLYVGITIIVLVLLLIGFLL